MLDNSTTPGGSSPQLEASLKYNEDMFATIQKSIEKLASSQIEGFSRRIMEFENAIMNLSTQFGGGRAFAETMRASFDQAEKNVVRMGGKFEDVLDIQQAANEAMGGTAILTSKAIEQIYAATSMVEGGIAVSKENAKSLIENFTKVGFSVLNIGQEVNRIMNVAKETGANAKILFDDIEKNMSRLNLFNFKNGVEGMAKMASTAQMLRVSMQETLDFAENLYDPEKAVEVASTFQRLGLGSMTNVYQLQDLARTDPGKLQEMLAQEFSRFVTVNEKTGERTINAYGQEIIRVLTKEVPGLKTDFIVQSGLAMADFQRKVEKIELPDFARDEELKNLIYRQAQLGEKGTEMEGKYVINIDGVARDISTLTTDQIEKLKAELKAQAEPNRDIIDAQRSSQAELLKLNNSIVALHNFYPSLLASNSKVNQGLQTLGATLSKGVDSLMKSKLFGITQTTTVGGGTRMDITGRKGAVDEMANKYLTSLGGNITSLISNVQGGMNLKEAFTLFANEMKGGLTGMLPTGVTGEMIENETTRIFKDVFGAMSSYITNPNITPGVTPSTTTVTTTTPTTVVNTPTALVPETPISPMTSVVNLVQQNPFDLNVNVNLPNIDQRFKDLLVNPIFMGEVTDGVVENLKMRYPRRRFDFEA